MKKLTLMLLTVVMVTVAIITQTGCAEKTDPVSKQSYYFDTICQITVYNMENMSQTKANDVIDDAFDLCSTYEDMLSKTKEGSDIYKINHAEGQPVVCSDETINVIKKGMEFGDLSDGKFDITIGTVSDLWDFHSSEPKIPDDEAIKETLKAVDYKQIHIDGNTVTMGNPKGEIDLGGIAKGYIGDKVAENLKKKGVTSAIISLGGNIVVIGDKAGEDFNIGVEKPYSDQSEIVGSVNVTNATVVTSGIYERFFEVDGKKYHHILDVNTGYPVNSDVEGVSLVGKLNHSVDCDALSTICLMLGVDKGKELIDSIDGIEAMFIDKAGNITKTDGFELVEN